MACHGVKNKGDVPLRRSWGGYIVGAPATLPLCHYWTGVVSLSPYVFCLSIQGKREQKRRVAKREKEKKKNRKKTERERKKKQRRRKKIRDEKHRDKKDRTERVKTEKKKKEKTQGLVSLHRKRRSIAAAATELPSHRLHHCKPPQTTSNTLLHSR
jgi:uncharacterized membrane protein YhiD involved in acid resistance